MPTTYGITIHRPQTKTINGADFYGQAISGDHVPSGSLAIPSRTVGAMFIGRLLGTGRLEASIGHKASPFDTITWEDWKTVDNAGLINQFVKDSIFSVRIRCSDFFYFSNWSLFHQRAGERTGLGKTVGTTTVSTIAAPTEMTFSYEKLYWELTWPKVTGAKAYRLAFWDGNVCGLGGDPRYHSTIIMQPEDGSNPKVFLVDSDTDLQLLKDIKLIYQIADSLDHIYSGEALRNQVLMRLPHLTSVINEQWDPRHTEAFLCGFNREVFDYIGKADFITGFGPTVEYFSAQIFPITTVEFNSSWSTCFPFCAIQTLSPWFADEDVLGPFELNDYINQFGYLDVTFTASDGHSPYTYALTGDLPAGVTWNSTTHRLTGYLGFTIGTYEFSITATDSEGCKITRDYVIILQLPTESVNFSITSPAEGAEFSFSDKIVITWENPVAPSSGVIPDYFLIQVKKAGAIVYTAVNDVVVYMQASNLTHTIPADTFDEEGDYDISVFAVYPES
jgi:hypothetical protein